MTTALIILGVSQALTLLVLWLCIRGLRARDARLDDHEDCVKAAEGAIRAAKEAELNAPLQARGLAADVRAMVADWPKVSWDEEVGTVVFS